MLEFYQAYATYTDLMDLTEAMVGELAHDVNGGTTVTWDGVEIELAPPWRRLSIRDAVRELGGVAEAARVFEDPAFAAETAIAHGVPAADVARVLLEGVPPDRGGICDHADVVTRLQGRRAARPTLARAIVERYDSSRRSGRVTRRPPRVPRVRSHRREPSSCSRRSSREFPLAVSPLARKNDRDPAFCDRFELFVHGKEIANGFSELNDPDDQRSRFQAQLRAKAAGAAETMDYDEDYCRALEVGMPPAAGEGIGIDRLAMLLDRPVLDPRRDPVPADAAGVTWRIDSAERLAAATAAR